MPLRRMARRVLGTAGRGLLRAGAGRGWSVILAYHNVIPDDAPRAGDRSLHIRVGDLARHLDYLQARTDVISLEALLAGGERSRLAVAITFDDAYEGTLRLGVPALKARGVPATVFVPPGLLDGRSFWWDDCADPEHGLSESLRARALGPLRGVELAVRAEARPAPVTLPPAYRAGTTELLHSALSHEGLTLGAHSWDHPNLAALSSGAELDHQLAAPPAWLGARFPGRVIPYLAYPYGLTSAAVMAALPAHGYRGALLVEGGRFRVHGNGSPWAIPRVSVPADLSIDGLAIRLMGLRRQ